MGDIVKFRDDIAMIVGQDGEKHLIQVFHNVATVAENELTALEDTVQHVDTTVSSTATPVGSIPAPVSAAVVTPPSPFPSTDTQTTPQGQ